MPALDASATFQVEKLREFAGSQTDETGHAVQIMPPPSYLRALLYEGNPKPIPGITSDVILVYKCRVKSSTSSLPIDVRDEINDSVDDGMDLGGDPLPAPFADDDVDISLTEKKVIPWPKGELNHYPLKLRDALDVLNRSSDCLDETSNELDVWCLVDGGVGKETRSKALNGSLNGFSDGNESADTSLLDPTNGTNSMKLKEKSRILVGSHATGEWWTRSFIESQGMCSAASPTMDPALMLKTHSEISLMPAHKTNVLCRYNIAGVPLASDVSSSASCASCVSLELEWRMPTIIVPLHDVFAKVVVQASVGHSSSRAHYIWKQLCVLQKLFEVLFTCWGNKTTPVDLPHLDPTPDDTLDEEIPQEPLESRIRTLVLCGQQALQAQTANRRMSVAPALLARQSVVPGRLSVAPGRFSVAPGRQSVAPSLLSRQSAAPNGRRKSIAPGFLDRMGAQASEEPKEDSEKKSMTLTEALDLTVAGNRHNADITDCLFNLLIECTTYRKLMSAWDSIFMELNDAQATFIRPKNNTRAAKLIQGFVHDKGESVPNFMEIEGSLFPLELLLEVGMEKLSADYSYIFSISRLAGREELQAPQLLRAGLGVPKERWLASCGQQLGWLAQVHCALEMALPLEGSMSEMTVQCMASNALKHFQSENSPIRSVEALLTPGNAIQEFSMTIPPVSVNEHVSRNFDWWRMTVTSESVTRRVKSVFLRSHLRPIFPPQLHENAETLIPTEGTESESYYCAEAITISEV